MKSTVLAGLLSIVVSPVVLAADVPSPMPQISPTASLYNWSGVYLGGALGWANNSNKFAGGAAIPPLGVGGAVDFPTITKDGFTGSFFAGYNHQINQIVVGVEGDVGYRTVGEKRHNQVWGDYLTAHTNWGGSIRGRLGYAFDRVLLYGTGGVAFQAAKATYGGLWGSIGLGDSVRWGWTLGAGMEYAFAKHWIAGVEYRYTDLGTDTFTWPVGFTHNLGVAGISQSTQSNQVTGRVSYKFQ